MATATLSIKQNNQTGKTEIHIEYESESDSLAHEHENEHRELVKKLLGDSAENSNIIIKRAAKKTPSSLEEKNTLPEIQKEKIKNS
jgi:hypothetical protein